MTFFEVKNRVTRLKQKNINFFASLPFHDGGRYHIETESNQWTGFYMITAPVMKELNQFIPYQFSVKI